MRPDDLQLLVVAIPFSPFRIVMHSGTVYEIRHPELVRGGRSSWRYYHVPPSPGFSERHDVLSYLLIERIEVAIPIPTSGNGG
jgi:hypothetical protein